MNNALAQERPSASPVGNEIIFVDDSEADLVIARVCYRRSGLSNRILTFSESQKFIEFLEQRERSKTAQPAVVLLDINMPGMSGFDVLSWIKKRKYFETLPCVLMLTSSIDPSDREKAERLGADKFVEKPSKTSEFVELLQRLET